MVNVHDVSIGFMILSGLIALGLLALSVSAFRRDRDPAMGFLAGAFTLFAAKSFMVGYALWSGAIGHSTLELVDAVGDLGTIVLLILPVFIPRK